MTEIPVDAFFNFFLYLFVPFALGFLFKKIKLSSIIGYILGGVILGNLLTSFIDRQTVNSFAVFGIILLLFTVGLEVNFSKLEGLKRYIVTGGVLLFSLLLIFITALNLFFGIGFFHSVLIAMALTSSSTAVVVKIIQERGEEGSFLGEVAIGILMLQDLMFIPVIILFTNIQTTGPTSFLGVGKNILLSLIESGFILWAMFYFGKSLVPRIFSLIAHTSRELLNLFIIVFIFFITFLTATFGIPVLVGAFIAGVLVSQTREHHHIFSQIRPLRDLMAIVFFVFIGSSIPIGQIIFLIPKIIMYAFSISAVKAIIIMGVFFYLKLSSRMVFSLAITLFQLSETSIILMTIARANQLVTQEEYLLVSSTVLLTLIVTPYLIKNKEGWYLRLRAFLKRFVPGLHMFIRHKVDFDTSPLDILKLKNHVIICGYGRIGSRIGKALNLAKIPFIAVDYNSHIVEKAKKEGINIVYGDPTDFDVLDFVETEHATVLVSAVPHRYDQESIILNAKKLNSRIFIVSRVHSEEEQQRLKDLGAHSVVQPELEASISIIKKIFLINNVARDDMLKWLRHIKLVHHTS
ncbi:MAG: cation:proton antiporter [Patescibacteria group bacterium]